MKKTVVSYKVCMEKRDKVSLWSVDWANLVLKDGIKELKNVNRDCDARICENLVRIRLLERKLYWWQAARLKNHLNRFWKNPKSILQAQESLTPLEGGGGESS